MKNMPDMTIQEIAKEFLDRAGLAVKDVVGNGAKQVPQEVTWARAKICVAAGKAGWSNHAIARYLNVGHDTVSRHRKMANAQSNSG